MNKKDYTLESLDSKIEKQIQKEVFLNDKLKELINPNQILEISDLTKPRADYLFNLYIYGTNFQVEKKKRNNDETGYFLEFSLKQDDYSVNFKNQRGIANA